jgi:hypothetical protein
MRKPTFQGETMSGFLGGYVERSVELTTLEFEVLWEQFRYDEPPVILRMPSPGRTEQERREIVWSTLDGIQAKGLGRPGEFNPLMVQLMANLNRPKKELDARFYQVGTTKIVGAVQDQQATIAILQGNTVTMKPASVTGVVHDIVTMLPKVPAGKGQSVSIQTSKFEKAAEGARTRALFQANLIDQGTREDDARNLTEMIGDISAQGQFGAAARDQWGGRKRADHIVGYWESNEGRYIQIKRTAPDGTAWTTFSPADHRRIEQHVRTMFEQILNRDQY